MNFVILIAAIAIAVLAFTWLVGVIKTTIRTALSVAVIIVALLVVFGIGPDVVFRQVAQIFQTIYQAIFGR